MIRMTMDTGIRKGIINKNIYGHFAEHLGRCIYEGIWVGEDSPIPNTNGFRNDVVKALRDMDIPNLRWPGGCFADAYHWRDGIGPKESRPSMVNTHWGGVTENNHFGTHEFLEFCDMIGAEPYICGNVGSGSVQEMKDWVEYITFEGKSPMSDLRKANGRQDPWKLTYFGVGNENWGCGGNMRAEYYADEYRRYATYVRNIARGIYRIAGGASVDDYHWTEVLMREAAKQMDGLSLHYYTRVSRTNWTEKGSATDFEADAWFSVLDNALYMEELITNHAAIMDKYDPEKRVGMIVDEWGTWFTVEPGTNPRFLYQQNTIRDALVAGIHLNIFNNHCDRVQMANLAQTVNVLQSVILTEGEKILLTPTYHVFDMYKVHQNAEMLPILFDGGIYTLGENSMPQISASASVNSKGEIHLSLCNLSHLETADVDCMLRGDAGTQISGTILSAKAMKDHNTFDQPDKVKPEVYSEARLENGIVQAVLPPMSVVTLRIS